jgi:uncharacterized SAM-binding protein YcdF (DUF218 family)
MSSAHPRDQKKAVNACAVLAFIPIALVFAMLLVVGILNLLGAILIIADPLHEADAIAVLSGGGDLERLNEAARLSNERYARWFILTETGETTLPESNAHLSNDLRKEAISLGVQNENILITKGIVNSTRDEAKSLKDILRFRRATSVIVVTDPYHTFRTRLIFLREFRGSGIQLIVHPVQGHWYHSYDWFLSKRGWQTTLLEYLKLTGALFNLGG